MLDAPRVVSLRTDITKKIMKKILHISHSPHWGGAEKCLYLLLKALPTDQFQSIVLLPEPGPLSEAIERLGIRTISGPFLPWVRPWMDHCRGPRLEEGVAEIARLIQAESIDVVFTNTSVTVGGALAARRCGVPHVWHILEMLSSDPHLDPPVRLPEFYLLLDLLSDRIVAASNSVKAEIAQHLTTTKIDVIHTSVGSVEQDTLERRKRIVFDVPEETFVVSFVGDMSERKGVEDLLRCVPDVLAHNPSAKFMIAGRDAERGEIVRTQIAEHNLHDAVQLLGFRDDVLNLMAASDVFVLPTLSDPLPLVVQEAMSVGTPVIATRSGGCEDMVADGETGCLVPVQDPQALGNAIVDLMKSPAKRASMGEQGRQRLATHFGTDAFVRKITGLFASVSEVKFPDTVSLGTRDVLNLLVQGLDACGARYRLAHQNQTLRESHAALEQSRDAIDRAFSTRLGRVLTLPWRGLKILLRLTRPRE